MIARKLFCKSAQTFHFKWTTLFSTYSLWPHAHCSSPYVWYFQSQLRLTKIRMNCSDISCSLIEMMWRSNSRNAVSFSILCMIKSIWHSKTWKMSRKKNLKKMKVQLMHLWAKGMMVLTVRVCRNRDKDLARTRCTRHTAATLSAWFSSSC